MPRQAFWAQEGGYCREGVCGFEEELWAGRQRVQVLRGFEEVTSVSLPSSFPNTVVMRKNESNERTYHSV